jgi:hypothetical protein
MMRVEAVGRWYESCVSHMTGAGHGAGGDGVGDSSSDEEDSSGSVGRGDSEEDDGTFPHGDVNPLLLDPTQWKVGKIYFMMHLIVSLIQPEA